MHTSVQSTLVSTCALCDVAHFIDLYVHLLLTLIHSFKHTGISLPIGYSAAKSQKIFLSVYRYISFISENVSHKCYKF
jgi:hypothetical protein